MWKSCEATRKQEGRVDREGDGRAKILNNGELLTLSPGQGLSGSGFQSKNEYMFGKIDMQLKLAPGNSASTVTAYYLSSKCSNWDGIDAESMGVPFPEDQPIRIYLSLQNADDWATRGRLIRTDWSNAPFMA
ncbi:hypothetical protein CDL15_Pgr010554 [Punica granatum]|uniref:GH16 domain-containing protein n=1 Tax=Punica granatum TaxID=22663 RepID=A0A218XW31_PUNGR|nr:hypothetical protein CDL15_Pgr010554 [Punica granatum]PKI59847.1 hypothetical protein CRG98_019729 [Punica granatum]